MIAAPLSAIGELVEPVSSWTPERDDPDGIFTYIDLSAVDQNDKIIVGAREIQCVEAPSRARQVVRAGDILVSTVRPNLNAVARVPSELDGATASTGFCVLRPRAGQLDGQYLYHWVKSPRFVSDMVRKATGASYPAVSDRIVYESQMPLSPMLEQRRIAAILDKADELRAKRRAALAKLDTLTQSIFLDMFGDPATNPKGWPGAMLGDLVFSASDGPHVSPSYVEEGVPILSTRHIRAGQISWEDLKFISAEDAEVQWRKCRPERGDVLYTKGGTTGLAAKVDTDRQFAVWVHIALLKLNPNKVEAVWLENMLNSEFCYRQSQVLTHGIANRDLGLTRMVKIRLYCPPLQEQQRFAQKVAVFVELKGTVRTALAKLDPLIASLQHRAFQGEL